MSNNQIPIPDRATLDREARARRVAELQGELAQERANSLAAQEIASRALVQRKEQEDATRIFRAQWCELVAATSAGRHLSVMRAQQRAALEWITNARGYEIRFKALEPKLKDCEAALELHRRSAQLQEQVRKADACTECKGTGEIGYINQTELGPEGDSSECDACFGSGSQAMADKIGAFLASEFAVLVKISELLATQCDIARDEFESESAHITRAINRLIDEGGKDYADMRRFQSDVIRLTHENDSLTAQLAAARAEVERLKSADNPGFDATDGASPAWWRGHDYTTKVFCALVNDILDGKDDGSGANREPWASTRKRLIGMCAEKSKWKRRANLFHQAYKEKDFESFALNLQKMQLEASGADVILPWQNRSLRARLLEGCKERNRLRAALAQVGDKVKAEAVRVLEYQLQMATENEASDAVNDGLAEAVHVISSMNLAAIVAASAETTGKP